MSKLVNFVSVPWAGFVAAFLYYVLLTLVAIGGSDLSAGFMVIAYGMPLLGYASFLAVRTASHPHGQSRAKHAM